MAVTGSGAQIYHYGGTADPPTPVQTIHDANLFSA